jgi:hypothetical protein
MSEGWQLFLLNLRLHLEHFRGRVASTALPTATWPGPRDRAWAALRSALGIPDALAVGDHVDIVAGDTPAMSGTVADAAPYRVALVLDHPAPGTAFIAAEGTGHDIAVSIWSYLYGDEADSIAARDGARWASWLAEHA